jgi:hypothetical protein
VGVNVVTSLDVTLTALGVDGLRPGDGGAPGGGVPGVAFGATIDATSRGAAFDAASRVHGEAFHYYDGERDVVIADEVLDAPAWPTNWGRITLRNVSGAEVRGTRVLGLTGGGARIRGSSGDPGIPPRPSACTSTRRRRASRCAAPSSRTSSAGRPDRTATPPKP